MLKSKYSIKTKPKVVNNILTKMFQAVYSYLLKTEN